MYIVGYFIKEPHRDSFITNDSLVMALGISDTFFSVSSVSEGMSQVLKIPVFILDLFEKFYPLIKYFVRSDMFYKVLAIN